jgi:hypothetical protein
LLPTPVAVRLLVEFEVPSAGLVERRTAGGADEVDDAVGGFARAGVGECAGCRAGADIDRAIGHGDGRTEIARGTAAADAVEAGDAQSAFEDRSLTRVGIVTESTSVPVSALIIPEAPVPESTPLMIPFVVPLAVTRILRWAPLRAMEFKKVTSCVEAAVPRFKLLAALGIK